MRLFAPIILNLLMLCCASTIETTDPPTQVKREPDVDFNVIGFENILFMARQPFSLKDILSETKIVKPWTPNADAKALIDWGSNLGGTWRTYRVGNGKITDICMKGVLIKMEEPTVFDVTRIYLGYQKHIQVYQWKAGKYQKTETIKRN